MRGKFTVYTDGNTAHPNLAIDFGAIQSVSMPYEPKVSTTSISGQPCENNFVMDTGVTRSVTVEFIRVCPRNPQDDYQHDSEEWSNGFWLHNVTKYIVNRWQMATDGIRFTYDEGDEIDKAFINIPMTNGYITEYSLQYRNTTVQAISGTIKIAVGGMYLNKVVNATVVYRANFSEKSSGVQTNTNQVKTYQTTDGITVEPFNPDWATYLYDKHHIVIDQSQVWFCTNTTDTFAEAKENGTAYLHNSSIEGVKAQIDFIGTTMVTLYARYSRD